MVDSVEKINQERKHFNDKIYNIHFLNDSQSTRHFALRKQIINTIINKKRIKFSFKKNFIYNDTQFEKESFINKQGYNIVTIYDLNLFI